MKAKKAVALATFLFACCLSVVPASAQSGHLRTHAAVALPLASLTPSTIVGHPGSSVTVVLQTPVLRLVGEFHFTIVPSSASAGFVVIPEVPSGAAQTFLIRIPASAPDGVYKMTFTPRSGAVLAKATAPTILKILVERPGSILTYFNNTGIANNHQVVPYSYDNSGNSYSAQLFAQFGLHPGKHILVDGIPFIWPDDFIGSPDNILADGQTIPLSGQGSELSILGSATNGPSRGMLVIHYTDGDEQAIILGMTDWTMNGGKKKVLLYGNRIAFATRYRDSSSGKPDHVHAYVYLAELPLLAGKTVSGVTLPGIISQGNIHIFAMTIASPKSSTTG